MPQTKEKIMGSRIGKLREVYREWKTKNPIDPETGQRPVFRIAIGPLSQDESSEEAKKKDKEKWGALMDAIIQFAQEIERENQKEQEKTGATKSTRSLQPIEVSIISAYGGLAAIQKQGEEKLKGTPLFFKDALAKSKAEGLTWEREYYKPLFTQPGALLSREALIRLGLDLQFKIIHWDEFERNLEFTTDTLPDTFTDALNLGRWASTDPAYKEAVNKTADGFVHRTLRRLGITKPQGVIKDSPEYTAYLEQDAAYSAKKQKFKELAVSYVLREVAPLTVGLMRRNIPAILYPTTMALKKNEPPAAITATLKKFRDSLEYIPKNMDSWTWCPYRVDQIYVGIKTNTNLVARAFRDGKISPQQPSPPPSSSRSHPEFFEHRSNFSSVQPTAPLAISVRGSSPIDPPAPMSLFKEIMSNWQKEVEKRECARKEWEHIRIEKMEKDMEAMRAEMENIKAMFEGILKLLSTPNRTLLVTPSASSEEQRKTPSL